MKSFASKISKYVGYGVLFASPLSALAQLGGGGGAGGGGDYGTTEPPPITSVDEVYDFTVRILGYLQTFFWVIVAIFVVLTAYKYLTSGGDEEKVKSAKQTLIYTVIAVVVALVATAVVAAISSFLNQE